MAEMRKDSKTTCANIWVRGSSDQREQFGNGSEGASRKERPPEQWWTDCLSSHETNKMLKQRKGRIGELVMANGEQGVILEIAGDTVKVKFDNGSFSYINIDQLVMDEGESYSKVLVCPVCKNAELEKKQGEADTVDRIYACKCGNTFSAQVKGGNI